MVTSHQPGLVWALETLWSYLQTVGLSDGSELSNTPRTTWLALTRLFPAQLGV